MGPFCFNQESGGLKGDQPFHGLALRRGLILAGV